MINWAISYPLLFCLSPVPPQNKQIKSLIHSFTYSYLLTPFYFVISNFTVSPEEKSICQYINRRSFENIMLCTELVASNFLMLPQYQNNTTLPSSCIKRKTTSLCPQNQMHTRCLINVFWKERKKKWMDG